MWADLNVASFLLSDGSFLVIVQVTRSSSVTGLVATPEMLEPHFLRLLNPDSPDRFPPLRPASEEHEEGVVTLPRLRNGESPRKAPPRSTQEARQAKTQVSSLRWCMYTLNRKWFDRLSRCFLVHPC